MKILFIADVVRKSGVEAVKKCLPGVISRNSIDVVIANGENGDGNGLTLDTALRLMESGIHAITTGNHTLKLTKDEQITSKQPIVLRPVNFPNHSIEEGYITLNLPGLRCKIAIVNLLGKINMGNEYIKDPFSLINELLPRVKQQTNIIIVDFHAQYTQEKIVMGYFLDGRVSALLGTHTHVGTLDARILPKGTAYITDIGMVGPQNSVIGVAIEPVLRHFLTQLPVKFEDAEGPVIFNSVCMEVDDSSGQASSIFRIDETVNI